MNLIWHLLEQKNNPTGTPREIHVNSTWLLCRYVEDQIWANFHVISTNFFDIISLIEKSKSCPSAFFDAISMVEKSTLFLRTFIDVISMVEKSTLEPRTFFCVISLFEISTAFLLTFLNLILMVEKSTLFARTFFDKISTNSIFDKNFVFFWVSFELMKTFEKVFLC